jgi:hypothetical protein
MDLTIAFIVAMVSGLYTSLWGAFKDSPYEDFKPRTFPRSIYFHIVLFLLLFFVPPFSHSVGQLGLVQLFFLVMGLERFLAEIYKGFFRSEDQAKYFVPSRITFFGRFVASDALRYGVGTIIVLLVFTVLWVGVELTNFWSFLLTAYGTGLLVSLGGAYKDAPFEGFQALKFQRSAAVLALLSPLFYYLNDPRAPVSLGFLVYMNGGLERFAVEYYKTYVQRNMSGKFRPDLTRIQQWIDRREWFHFAALVIVATVATAVALESTGVIDWSASAPAGLPPAP